MLRPLVPLLAVLASALLPPASATGQTRPPNLIVIMIDDMGWADLGCYGGKAIDTPHLDRLAAQGMRFSQAYSGCTVCAPARSTLMTGKHMGHTSVRLNTGGAPLAADDDPTIAALLRARGYATGGFGKWGLGDIGTTGVPEKHGFDEFFGYYHQIHAHYFYPDYLVHNSVKIPLPGNAGFYAGRPKPGAFAAFDPQTRMPRQYAQYEIFRRNLDFIRAHKDRPFFCYAAWTPPHGRFEIPRDDSAWQRYAEREWPIQARVSAAMVTMIDRQVGELIALLRELDIVEQTYVLFCSDHGADERFEGSLDSCGPLRGRKRSMYEGGLRVPLIAWAPGRVAAGRTSDHVCYFPDFLPTLCDLAGTKPPSGTDGISFAPTLRGRGDQLQHETLYWEWQRYNWGKRQLEPTGLMQALRRGNLKCVRHRTDAPLEIYDVVADPGEKRNLAGDRPELVARFEKLLAESRVPMRAQREPEMPAGRKYR